MQKKFDKLIQKENDLCMSYYVNGEEFCFATASLDKNNNLVLEFWAWINPSLFGDSFTNQISGIFNFLRKKSSFQ